MESLIRAYISSKKPHLVENLIIDILSDISDKYDIDKEDLIESSTRFLSERSSKSRCEEILKNGTRCVCPVVPDESHCRRHLARKNNALERSRCIGITNKGDQCLSDACHGSSYCKLHERKRQNDELRSPCVYYDEHDDDNLEFCENTAVIGKWTCKKHAHLERNQTSLYRYSNLLAYKNRPVQESSNSILESLLD